MIVPASPDELTRYVLAAGESPNVDAKGPCAWEGDDAAKLCKDIIALANRRDGGVLVIGKSEPERGRFEFDGLAPEQQATFETTRVGQWVNCRVSQPITIVCHRHDCDGKKFVVITVHEFDDVPIMCTSDCFAAEDRQKKLLRAGDIYVRTENAETSTLRRPEDLRALIGLAVTKRAEQFAGIVRALTAGQPLSGKPAESPYPALVDEMRAELLQLGEPPVRGYWLLGFYPEVFAERWDDIATMRAHIREHTVTIRGPYPYPYPDCHGFQWGFAVDDPVDGGGYGFSYSGAFMHVLPFREDREGCRPCNRFPRAQTPLELSAGTWLEYQWSMFQVMEFFLFASRIFGTAPATELFVLRVEAHGLRGRQLVTLNRSIVMPTFDPCRPDGFSWTATVSAGSFLTTWKAECVRCLELFYRLFAAGEITSDILRHWIDKFETRSF